MSRTVSMLRLLESQEHNNNLLEQLEEPGKAGVIKGDRDKIKNFSGEK